MHIQTRKRQSTKIRAKKGILQMALVAITLGLLSSLISTAMATQISGVPYHAQVKWYYCGPACLEMVFDYYGPDVDQYEIADAAETDVAIGGTWSNDMRRAAHFSDLSESQGNEMPGSYWGYTARGLGYAAFTHSFTGIDQLKPLIDAGYPIIVLTAGDQDSADDPSADSSWGHYRVVVGYDDAVPEITMQDPLFGADYKLSYTTFDYWWDAWSGRWGLFTQPWNVVLSAPGSVSQGDTFTVSATVTYPCPSPFSTAYPASSSQATIQLPPELSLAVGETNPKTLDTGTMLAGGSATVQWDVDADSAGTVTISVEAEGQISPSYTDRIGGASEISVTVAGVGDGWIEGHVTDVDTGLPLDGATVSADGYSDVTDASGFYSIHVPPGTYSATAQMAGYDSQTVAGVTVVADTVTTQDFALTPVIPGHWNVVLTASKEGYSDVSDFGVRPDATDCFDPAYDEIDTPAPPAGVVSYFWHPCCPSTPVDQRKLATSKIAPAPLMMWTYKVKPVAIDGTMCISWSAGDVASIPLELGVDLHCPDGSVVNMRTETEYCFPAESDTTYTFTIHVGGWNVVLTASKEGYSDVSDFGVRKDATDCFDPVYDEIDTPAPPAGVVSYFWHPDCPSTPVDQRKLATSKIAPAPLMMWTYKVKPVAIDGTMCISWSAGDVASIPLELGVYLHCPDCAVINMRAVTEYCFPAESDTTYTFTIGVGGCSFELHLSAGWNMVSFPCLPDDPSFDNILCGVDFYQVLTWDGTKYVSPTTAEAGRGYWVLVLTDTTVTVANGNPVESYERKFCGWSMIGSIITCTVDADCVFPDYYRLYTWDGTQYVGTTVIEPGKGYWALVLTCTQIVVDDSCCTP